MFTWIVRCGTRQAEEPRSGPHTSPPEPPTPLSTVLVLDAVHEVDRWYCSVACSEAQAELVL